MGRTKSRVIVLTSGGIDSTAALYYYTQSDYFVEGFFVDYGQKAKTMEYASAKNACKHYNVELTRIQIGNSTKFSDGEIPGRNAFLILSVLMFGGLNEGIISSGIHTGTPYFDCTQIFVKCINDMLNGYTGGKVVFDAPFVKWTKRMIVDYSKANGVPLSSTYSCENGEDPPCGHCLSCKDRVILNV